MPCTSTQTECGEQFDKEKEKKDRQARRKLKENRKQQTQENRVVRPINP